MNFTEFSIAAIGLFLVNLIVLGAGAFVLGFMAHLGWNLI